MELRRLEMWKKADTKGIKAKCEYLPDRQEYLITVFKDQIKFTGRFPHRLPPSFGMDLYDYQQSIRLADQLAGKIDFLLKRPLI